MSTKLILVTPWACFSKVAKLYGPISGAKFLYIFATQSFKAIKLCNPLGFSYIKKTLRDQLLKASGLQFDKWLLGPENITGLSRNRPLVPDDVLQCIDSFLICFLFRMRWFETLLMAWSGVVFKSNGNLRENTPPERS